MFLTIIRIVLAIVFLVSLWFLYRSSQDDIIAILLTQWTDDEIAQVIRWVSWIPAITGGLFLLSFI